MAAGKLTIGTAGAEETRRLGEAVGRALERPMVIALHGTLGSGKTVFVQGLARGLDVPPEYYITSPTFTLINEYPGRLPLCHCDLYRLDEESDLAEIGLEDVLAGDNVVAVEWAEKLPPAAGVDGLDIRFEVLAPDRRRITLIGSGQCSDGLLKAVAYF